MDQSQWAEVRMAVLTLLFRLTILQLCHDANTLSPIFLAMHQAIGVKA